jgi:hypothetical protein
MLAQKSFNYSALGPARRRSEHIHTRQWVPWSLLCLILAAERLNKGQRGHFWTGVFFVRLGFEKKENSSPHNAKKKVNGADQWHPGSNLAYLC